MEFETTGIDIHHIVFLQHRLTTGRLDGKAIVPVDRLELLLDWAVSVRTFGGEKSDSTSKPP